MNSTSLLAPQQPCHPPQLPSTPNQLPIREVLQVRHLLIDITWAGLIFTIITLTVLFATGQEARFIYTDF